MSTVVAVKKDGIIVIGADTMTKYGRSYQSSSILKNHSKIVKVEDNYLAYVGEASFGLILANYFKRMDKIPQLNSVESIFEIACDLHEVLKDKYFLNPHNEDLDDFESSRFDCLIANPQGIFGLYELRSVDEFTKFYAFGTGRRFALGAMNALYDTKASAEEIAKVGLEAAAEFDDSTGRPFEIYTIEAKA